MADVMSMSEWQHDAAVHEVACRLVTVEHELQNEIHGFVAFPDEVAADESVADEDKAAMSEPLHEALALAVPLLQALHEARAGFEMYCSNLELDAERLRHIGGVLMMAHGFADAFQCGEGLHTAVRNASDAVDSLLSADDAEHAG